MDATWRTRYCDSSDGDGDRVEMELMVMVIFTVMEVVLMLILVTFTSLRQDFWDLSGIFRDVAIYSVPQFHVRDYFAKPQLDQSCSNGTLHADVTIHNYAQHEATYASSHHITSHKRDGG